MVAHVFAVCQQGMPLPRPAVSACVGMVSQIDGPSFGDNIVQGSAVQQNHLDFKKKYGSERGSFCFGSRCPSALFVAALGRHLMLPRLDSFSGWQPKSNCWPHSRHKC